MQNLVAIVLAAVFAGCGSHPEPASSAPAKPKPRPVAPADADGVAYFAGGCFWGVEHFLEQIDGVASVESGYMGGHIDSPTYEQVSSQKSGHLETVRVRFDSSRVTFRAVAKRFFEIHDPTQANGQGPDIGPEYRSAVFYTSAEQKAVAEELIGQLRKLGYDVATELRPAATFWEAEAYHQDYYVRKGSTPYCHSPVSRFDHPAKNK